MFFSFAFGFGAVRGGGGKEKEPRRARRAQRELWFLFVPLGLVRYLVVACPGGVAGPGGG